MDGNPPRPPRPQRSPPRESRRPPLMERNSTTGGLAPSQRNDSDGLRTRTFSADVHEGITTNANSARYHRHNRSKVRFENVDPRLMMSLERPDLEDEAETVSFYIYYIRIDFIWHVASCFGNSDYTV